ncbi:hypothetical protein HC776_02995 [bacterium]|nr:hypothetical protein [bacterium]
MGIDEGFCAHHAGVNIKLEAVSVNEERVRVFEHHVQIVEVAHHHARLMNLAEGLADLPEEHRHLCRLDGMLGAIFFGGQRTNLGHLSGQEAHGEAHNGLALLIEGEFVRRDDAGRQAVCQRQHRLELLFAHGIRREIEFKRLALAAEHGCFPAHADHILIGE